MSGLGSYPDSVARDGYCFHKYVEFGIDSTDTPYRYCLNCGNADIVSMSRSQFEALRRAIFSSDGRRRVRS